MPEEVSRTCIQRAAALANLFGRFDAARLRIKKWEIEESGSRYAVSPEKAWDPHRDPQELEEVVLNAKRQRLIKDSLADLLGPDLGALEAAGRGFCDDDGCYITGDISEAVPHLEAARAKILKALVEDVIACAKGE